MRISTPSVSRMLPPLLLAAATGALAQDSARDRIDAQGSAALDRLQASLDRTRDAGARLPEPQLPAGPTEMDRQRTLEALLLRQSDEAMDARARAALARGEAALASEREAQARKLREALGLEPGAGEALPATTPGHALAWVPVLFVSSSMPLPVLRAYAAQLEKARGVLAFRGMPGGLSKVGPMARLSAQILRLDPGCEGPACAMRNVQLIVDPIVFRQHGIGRVPALAMVPGDPTQAYCEREEDSPRAIAVVFGDSALSGLLEEYARLGGAREVKDAQALLAPR